jgi:hypothetical protein
MRMSDDYAKGFKDGFKIGLEEGKRHQNLNPVPYTLPYEPLTKTKDNCPKCGIKISGVMGYVCTSINCPTFPQVTCTTNNSRPNDSFYEPFDCMISNGIGDYHR